MGTDRFKQYNDFTPLAVTPRTRGRSGNRNQSFDLQQTSSQNFSNLVRNRSYALMDEGRENLRANPPFLLGSSGRVLGSISDQAAGADPRIARGYIRRSVLDDSDPTSNARLYFMYNPETITRNYVSYLDQAALDPFNTVFGSNNLVAPPGILDFSFDMFFDRQAENANGSMPRGVLEDFDYFDLVIRGVVPDPQMPALPDSGVLMTNPRNITVVFSPQLSVQGRPNQASVSYEKFDHRMRPIRMRITINMKAFYIGPVRTDFTFSPSQQEKTFDATIPYEDSVVTVTTESVDLYIQKGSAILTGLFKPSSGGGSTSNPTLDQTSGIANSSDIAAKALAFAEYLIGENPAVFPYKRGPYVPADPREGLDCAGLVYWAYRGLGALAALGLEANNICNGNMIWDAARRMGTLVAEYDAFTPSVIATLQPGDIMIGAPHVAMVHRVDPQAGIVYTYESYGNHGPGFLEWGYDGILGHPNYHVSAVRPRAAATQTVLNV